MLLKETALETAFSVLSVPATVAGRVTKVIFEKNSQIVDSFGNKVLGESPRIYLRKDIQLCEGTTVSVGGDDYEILSIKNEGIYDCLELGKITN